MGNSRTKDGHCQACPRHPGIPWQAAGERTAVGGGRDTARPSLGKIRANGGDFTPPSHPLPDPYLGLFCCAISVGDTAVSLAAWTEYMPYTARAVPIGTRKKKIELHRVMTPETSRSASLSRRIDSLAQASGGARVGKKKGGWDSDRININGTRARGAKWIFYGTDKTCPIASAQGVKGKKKEKAKAKAPRTQKSSPRRTPQISHPSRDARGNAALVYSRDRP